MDVIVVARSATSLKPDFAVVEIQPGFQVRLDKNLADARIVVQRSYDVLCAISFKLPVGP